MKCFPFRQPALVGCILMLLAGSTHGADGDVRTSIVKILTTHRFPDLTKPWTRDPAKKSSGTGVVIAGKRILTNAHVVRYASQIYVQAYQSDSKIPAKLIAMASGIDLAILELEDDSFFESRPAVAFAEQLPQTKDGVSVYGYPLGGDELSITEGIVSRIEFVGYYRNTLGLRIQVDAALNPGNSGGPGMKDGKLMGLVFSGIRQADNIGYLIPTEEINLFLEDVADGKYDGKLRMFTELQTTENKALRARLDMDESLGGVIVQQPADSTHESVLREWDVITKIGDHDIDREGKVQIANDLRLHFMYLIPKVAQDAKIPLTILREGQSLDVQLQLRIDRNLLLKPLKNTYPSYFILGPFVFSVATQDLVERLGRLETLLTLRQSPMIYRRADECAFEDEQMVIVASRMFPHEISKGYDDPILHVVDRVNGVQIKNLAHLITTLRDADTEYLELRFAGRHHEFLVFRREQLIEVTEEILEENGIRYQSSEDVRDIWPANAN